MYFAETVGDKITFRITAQLFVEFVELSEIAVDIVFHHIFIDVSYFVIPVLLKSGFAVSFHTCECFNVDDLIIKEMPKATRLRQ
jgi:hypothetical protein